jgi:hypothetical protein
LKFHNWEEVRRENVQEARPNARGANWLPPPNVAPSQLLPPANPSQAVPQEKKAADCYGTTAPLSTFEMAARSSVLLAFNNQVVMVQLAAPASLLHPHVANPMPCEETYCGRVENAMLNNLVNNLVNFPVVSRRMKSKCAGFSG